MARARLGSPGDSVARIDARGNLDHWARVRKVVRAIFLHPLVRWLLTCLDGAREQVCDASVVSHGIPPRDLARALLDFAKRQATNRSLVTLGLANSFLNRLTVKQRIHILMEEQNMFWTTPLSHRRRFALVTATFVLILGISGFVVHGATAQAQYPATPGLEGALQEPDKNAPPTKVENRPAKYDASSGIVEDEAGQPVAGATVVEHPANPGTRPIMTVSGVDGTFKLELNLK